MRSPITRILSGFSGSPARKIGGRVGILFYWGRFWTRRKASNPLEFLSDTSAQVCLHGPAKALPVLGIVAQNADRLWIGFDIPILMGES
jgi:hypothetical protein